MNLLPWREEAQLTRVRCVWIGILCVTGVAWISSGIGHMYLKQFLSQERLFTAKIQAIQKENSRNQLAREQYQQTKRQWRQQIEKIQQVHVQRVKLIRLFNELMQDLPPQVTLTSLQRLGDKLILHGMALNSSEVSQLMQRLAKHSVSRKPVLLEIKQASREGRRYHFCMEYWQDA